MKTTFALIIVTLAFMTSAYAEIKINVLGEVNRQGHFVIEKGQLGEGPVTLLDALGLAEGVSEHANLKKILIRRAGEEVTVIQIDLMAIINGGAKNPILNDGDLVYVNKSTF